MVITTRSGIVLSYQNSAGTKKEQVKEQVGTEDDESAHVDDLEEIQHRATLAGRKEKEIHEKFFYSRFLDLLLLNLKDSKRRLKMESLQSSTPC